MTHLRTALAEDVPAPQRLIVRSARELSTPYYTPEQTEAAIRHVFGVDSQLIADRTYFVIESDGQVVACGGWSKRRTLFGGDQTKVGPDPLLDPTADAPGSGRSSSIRAWRAGASGAASWPSA